MYAYLKGELVAKKQDRIVIEVGGIGYNVIYPAGRIPYLPSVGSELTVYTYTSVREDALQLYGFRSEDDLELFTMLIGVSGVGPKAAQGLLSELTASDIRLAIIGEDTKTLCKAPGVAKKTAERIIVDLKSKIDAGDVASIAGCRDESGVGDSYDGVFGDAEKETLEALIALGYGAKEAKFAVERAIALDAGRDTEIMLKMALRFL